MLVRLNGTLSDHRSLQPQCYCQARQENDIWDPCSYRERQIWSPEAGLRTVPTPPHHNGCTSMSFILTLGSNSITSTNFSLRSLERTSPNPELWVSTLSAPHLTAFRVHAMLLSIYMSVLLIALLKNFIPKR